MRSGSASHGRKADLDGFGAQKVPYEIGSWSTSLFHHADEVTVHLRRILFDMAGEVVRLARPPRRASALSSTMPVVAA